MKWTSSGIVRSSMTPCQPSRKPDQLVVVDASRPCARLLGSPRSVLGSRRHRSAFRLASRARYAGIRSPVPCRADVGDRRHRCRHDGRARVRGRRRRDAARLVVPRVHAVLPRAGVGRARRVEIWKVDAADLRRAARLDSTSPSRPSASPNQRETVVVWDRRTGEPLHRAIVWQDRRTAERCDELRDAGHLAS